MTKDRLTSEQIGKVLLEILKTNAKYNNQRLNRLLNLADQPKPTVSIKHIKDELIYLDIYIIHQAISLTLQSSFDEIEKHFEKELKHFLENKASRGFTLSNMINILKAKNDYMEMHNNTIAKDGKSKGLPKFAHYISARILGEHAGHDIRYVVYFTDFYVTGLTSLIDLIKNSMEIVPGNKEIKIQNKTVPVSLAEELFLFSFLELFKDLAITEEDCGTLNGISVSSDLLQGDEIIKSFKERINGRFVADDIVNIITNKIIVSADDYITEEKAEVIEKIGILKIRVRSVFTCQTERGVCLKCYGRYNLAGDLVEVGEEIGVEAVYAWEMLQINKQLRNLLEARIPDNPSVMCQIDGIAEISQHKNGWKIIFVNNHTGFRKRHYISPNKKIKINNGAKVFAGQKLTDGEINPHDVLRWTGGQKRFLEYMKNKILSYLPRSPLDRRLSYLPKSPFDERLIEMLVRQIIKLKIEDIGDTSFKVGQLVNEVEFMKENTRAIRNGKRSAFASPIFIGISLE
ncbi:hypothetical protein KJ830_01610 [bacterium]|nr:hypothetical protein [bacterium]